MESLTLGWEGSHSDTGDSDHWPVRIEDKKRFGYAPAGMTDVFNAQHNYYAEMGDINEDGIVNVVDIVDLVNYILGISTYDEEQIAKMDFNQDGNINVADVLSMTSIVLGAKEWPCPSMVWDECGFCSGPGPTFPCCNNEFACPTNSPDPDAITDCSEITGLNGQHGGFDDCGVCGGNNYFGIHWFTDWDIEK